MAAELETKCPPLLHLLVAVELAMQFRLRAYQRHSRRFLNCLLNYLQSVGKCIRHQVRFSMVLAVLVDVQSLSRSTFRMPLRRSRYSIRRPTIQVDLAAAALHNQAFRQVHRTIAEALTSRVTKRQFGLSTNHDISPHIVVRTVVPADDFRKALRAKSSIVLI